MLGFIRSFHVVGLRITSLASLHSLETRKTIMTTRTKQHVVPFTTAQRGRIGDLCAFLTKRTGRSVVTDYATCENGTHYVGLMLDELDDGAGIEIDGPLVTMTTGTGLKADDGVITVIHYGAMGGDKAQFDSALTLAQEEALHAWYMKTGVALDFTH